MLTESLKNYLPNWSLDIVFLRMSKAAEYRLENLKNNIPSSRCFYGILDSYFQDNHAFSTTLVFALICGV